MNRDIVFVTFDAPRPDYDPMPYGIACLIAAIQKAGFVASHFPINTRSVLADRDDVSEYVCFKKSEEFRKYRQEITNLVQNQIEDSIDWLKKFRYVAFTYTRWSADFCKNAADSLWYNHYCDEDKGGKIIFGGYEITAFSDEMLDKLKMAHIFTKGYAEKAYVDILKGESGESLKNSQIEYHKVFRGAVSETDIVSPYLTGVLKPFRRKVYWETARGCPYRCGFCEWGAQSKEERSVIIELDWESRLKKELELFYESGVEEINILDGAFFLSKAKKNTLHILDDIFQKSDIKVVCQARFEALRPPFLQMCEDNKSRIHLEFGLQTIHRNEACEIGRVNFMKVVKEQLAELEKRGISYEVSLIYAIPGQTIYSFIDSIEFLLSYKCKMIRAFPLQIAANSEIFKKCNYISGHRNENELTKSVVASDSFSEYESKQMDFLAERLLGNPQDRFYSFESTSRLCEADAKMKGHEYLYSFSCDDIKKLDERETKLLCYLIERYFIDYNRLKKSGEDKECLKIEEYLGDYDKVFRCQVLLGRSGNFYIMSLKNTDNKMADFIGEK